MYRSNPIRPGDYKARIAGNAPRNTAWNTKTAIKQDKINWLHVNDDKGVVAGKWNVMYIPNTYLLDKTGKVVAVNPSHQQLDELIQKLLL